MRLLITGGSGYLGQVLVPLAVEQGHDVIYTTYSKDPLGWGVQVDLMDETAVNDLLTTAKPDAIIHTAGSNRTPNMADVIIMSADLLSRFSGRIVHLSTDVVFEGTNAPYTELDAPAAPRHDYGRSKLAAENIMLLQHPNNMVVRTSLIYGLKQMDHGTRWISEALQAGKPVNLFTNQMRNPVWVNNLALACLELAQSQHKGILHVAGSEVMSRAEFALKLLDYWGIHQRDSLNLVEDDGTRWPLNCVLDISKAQSLLKTPLLSVSEVLENSANQTK